MNFMQCLLYSDALYFVQYECIVFPLFGLCVIPVVLPDSHQYLRGYCRCHGPSSAVGRALDS